MDALLEQVQNGDVGGKVTVDSSLSTESENPVMNKVITEELNKKSEEIGIVTKTYACNGNSKVLIVSDINIKDVSSNMMFVLKMTYQYAQDSAPTLKVGYSDAKPLYYRGKEVGKYNSWNRGEYVLVKYSQLDSCYYAEPLDWSDYIKSMVSGLKITDGYYVNGDDLVANGGYMASDFYPVVPNETYVSNYNHRLYFYDAYKNVVGSFITANEFTIPQNCYYVRLSSNQYIKSLYVLPKKGIDKVAGYVQKKLDLLSALETGVTWEGVGFIDFANGAIKVDNSYKYSSLVPIREGVNYKVVAHRVAYYDINGEYVGYKDAPNGNVTIPTGSKFMRIDSNVSNLEKSYVLGEVNNIATYSDILDLSKKIEYKTDFANTLQSVSELEKDGIICTGEAGAVNAVYSIPICNNGNYSVSFKFRMPRGIQADGNEVVLAAFGNKEIVSGTFGGFLIKLKPSTPISNAPYQQALYKGGISFYPCYQTGNNYRADYVPDCKWQKPFVGEDIFSLRYKGNMTDVLMDITDEGIRVYSTSNGNIMEIAFPSSKGFGTFVTDLKNKAAELGVFDFVELCPVESTDDIIRVSAIPMVGSYSRNGVATNESFPAYVQAVDKDWHTIDIRFSAHGNNVVADSTNQDDPIKGDNILAFFIDGMEVRCIDNRFPLVGSGQFYGNLTLGCEGVEVKDFEIKSRSEISSPIIMVLYAHALNLQQLGSAKNIKIGLSTMRYVANAMREHGFVYVTQQEIADHFINKKPLPHKCWVMMHDDTFYLDGVNEGNFANGDAEASRKFRQFYMANAIKADFPMIDTYYTGDNSALGELCRKNGDFFSFSLHSGVQYSNVDYETIIADITKQKAALENVGLTSNVFTYNQGLFDYNTPHILQEYGVGVAYTITNTYLRRAYCSKVGAARAYYSLAQARLPIDNNAFDKATFENMLRFMDSI